VAITAAKSQKIVALHHAVLAVADFATLFGILRRCLGAMESLVFLCKKKVIKGKKDLKTVKSGDPKPKKQNVATKKHVAAAIALNH
jgi:hypothetical protein